MELIKTKTILRRKKGAPVTVRTAGDGGGYSSGDTGYAERAAYAEAAGMIRGMNDVLYPVDSAGNRVEWYSPQIHAIKAVKTLFSAQGVSARGLSETQAGGGTGGSSTLGALTDVTLGTLKSGDALIYDGTKWTNQPVKVGIDETALATYLSANRYAKLSDIPSLDGCVQKAGDTMTGDLYVRAFLNAQDIWLEYTNEINTGSGRLCIGYRNTPDGVNLCYNNAPLTYGSSGVKIWHENNDGPGSGLDADLLDGQHLSDILDGNVHSATYLQYDRKIWGQYFNGGNDVSGDIIGAAGAIAIHETNEINSFKGYLYLNHRGAGHTLGTTSHIIMCGNGGRVGIGTTTPNYKLHVVGDVLADNAWLRTTGATGWYNDDYGGGWFMQNSTYIENYGVKRVKLTGPQSYYDLWLAGGGICCEGNAGWGWNAGYGCINAGIADNSAQTPLMVAYRNGEAFENGEAGRLFSMELLNNGSQVWLNFGGTNRFKFWATGELYAQTGVWSNGYISARGQNTGSDIRLKDILGDCPLTVEQVAELPAVRFRWKDNGTVAVGTIAQEVRKVLPEIVTERPQDGMLGVDYGVLGYLSAHAVAVKVMEHESRLERIEKLLGITE